MLRVGDDAPELSAPTTQGPRFTLAAQRGRIVVVYFFRKAFTRNCTVETKGFRDNYPELRAIGAEVVGISCDSHETQCRFMEAHEVSFPMIADSDRAISRGWDVFFPLIPISHRVTYVISREGKIAGVFNHEFAVNKHLDEVLRFVHQLAKDDPPRRESLSRTGQRRGLTGSESAGLTSSETGARTASSETGAIRTPGSGTTPLSDSGTLPLSQTGSRLSDTGARRAAFSDTGGRKLSDSGSRVLSDTDPLADTGSRRPLSRTGPRPSPDLGRTGPRHTPPHGSE